MSISKKIRFEIFKRDGFTCQYCGKHPPEVTLEVDHINPKSKKGTDDINNLITACFDCNRGKSNIKLTRIPSSLNDNIEVLKERENQYAEYNKILCKIDRRVNAEILEVTKLYENSFSNWIINETFKQTTLKKFIEKLGVREVLDAMNISCIKFKGSKQFYQTGISANEAAIKYFCGICWNKIKNNE